MGSTRRAFTPEYKEQSVAFVLDGVREVTLGKWVKVARAATESGKSLDAPLGESGRAELVRLRDESRDGKSAIAGLRMQAAFAGRVAAWFVKGRQ